MIIDWEKILERDLKWEGQGGGEIARRRLCACVWRAHRTERVDQLAEHRFRMEMCEKGGRPKEDLRRREGKNTDAGAAMAMAMAKTTRETAASIIFSAFLFLCFTVTQLWLGAWPGGRERARDEMNLADLEWTVQKKNKAKWEAEKKGRCGDDKRPNLELERP